MLFYKKQHLLCLLLILFSIVTSQAAIIYVDINVSGGSHDGTSWTNAYPSLHTALANANSGDRIWVAQGTYLTSTTGDQSASFTLKNGVVLLGGFLPTHATEGERDYTIYTTILSADLDGDDIPNGLNRTDNGYTVVYAENVNSSTTLDGFTITGGNAEGSGDNQGRNRSGGGLFNVALTCGSESSPTIRNCIFDENRAIFYGGGIYNNAGIDVDCTSNTKTVNPIIENCTFTNNYAGNSGGGMYNDGAQEGTCNPQVNKCLFSQNEALIAAGAVYNSGQEGISRPVFNSCQFSSNKVPLTPIAYAGAVLNFGKDGIAEPKFINCLFNANQAYSAGAMYNLAPTGISSPLVLNCLFYNNMSTTNAGAIYANGGNGPNQGTSEPEVINCIFWNNSAGPWGGDIFRVNYATINISYSIVDEANCGALVAGPGGTVNCGSGMLYNIDPLFEDVSINDFNLQLGSPAIDAGNDTELNNNNILEDLNNQTRFVNTSDFGPYENQSVPLPVDLLFFSARPTNGIIAIHWETASEQNVSHYMIERSQSGSDWKSLIETQAVGFTNSFQTYSDQDLHPLNGKSYYRLKVVDFDGSIQYGPIVAVELPFDQVSIFPNPVEEQLNVSVGDFVGRTLNYQILSSDGQLLQQGRVDIRHGRTIFSVPVSPKWTPGIYFIKIYDDGVKAVTKSFVKVGL